MEEEVEVEEVEGEVERREDHGMIEGEIPTIIRAVESGLTIRQRQKDTNLSVTDLEKKVFYSLITLSAQQGGSNISQPASSQN